MIYPEFLKTGDTIGICAPSEGIGGRLENYEASINALKERGYKIIETEHVRVNDRRGGTDRQRGDELTSLFLNPEVKAVMAATGGDFLNEMLPYIDWDAIGMHPKWFLGASDPTGILFPLTTGLGIASLYGSNAGSFAPAEKNIYTEDTLSILEGKIGVMKSSAMHAEIPDFLPEYNGTDTPTVWKSNRSSIDISGRCVGGCIDVMKDLIGTRYDHVQNFINQYAQDGFIWFFDNFSQSAEVFYRTLCQFKYASWFEHIKAVIVGRVCFPSSDTGMSYGEALERALPDIPYVYEADIGHTVPAMPIINGAIMHLQYINGSGSVSFDLK